MPGKPQDLSNIKFDKLTPIECFSRGENKSALWRCRCDCGSEIVITASALKQNRPHSCQSCKSAKMWNTRQSHRESKSRLYRIYYNMRKRCENENAVNYHNYGARGITVCDEWKSYSNFSTWAKNNGYTDELTLERVNGDKGYSPENCRWATYKEQANNTRQNRYFTFNGETLTLTEWSARLGISKNTISQRLKYGWSVEEALSTPVRRRCV